MKKLFFLSLLMVTLSAQAQYFQRDFNLDYATPSSGMNSYAAESERFIILAAVYLQIISMPALAPAISLFKNEEQQFRDQETICKRIGP
ncbi:MAG: hypothetical protein H0W62_12675 [Chitinophagales bacterium]|nr:hypothetical protein [Chitinophagales bacterium]